MRCRAGGHGLGGGGGLSAIQGPPPAACVCGEQWGHLQGRVVVGMGGDWWESEGESDTVTSEAEQMQRQGPSGQNSLSGWDKSISKDGASIAFVFNQALSVFEYPHSKKVSYLKACAHCLLPLHPSPSGGIFLHFLCSHLLIEGSNKLPFPFSSG